jgi:hypothetical protein
VAELVGEGDGIMEDECRGVQGGRGGEEGEDVPLRDGVDPIDEWHLLHQCVYVKEQKESEGQSKDKLQT